MSGHPHAPAPSGVTKTEKLEADTEVTEVAPGVLRLQLPIQMPGLGHVNCYALEDERGVALVDPGLPNPEEFEALAARLTSVGIPVERVHTVVVTHSHPDHFGGAGRLRIMNDAAVVAHRSFRTIFDPFDDDTAELFDALAPKVDDDGFDPARFGEYLMGDDEIPEIPGRLAPWGGEIPFPSPDEIAYMRSWDTLTKQGFMSPQPTQRLDDAQVVRLGRREWVAVHTPGHTGDHLCLYDPADGILLSGDHVLPTITPHISGLSQSGDALSDYIEALDKVAGLEGVRHVLPAHGTPFTDLQRRIDDIKRHHHERLELVRDIARRLGTADVTAFSRELFQQRSWGSMAESETYAHLEHLRLAGEATARRDEDGRLRYQLIEA
jgi:glyoxylase-like metal-dependent hydrolase (beta-lactamase superfamily II)